MEKEFDLSEYIVSTGEAEGRHTLIFLHYFGGSAQSWKWVMDILTNKFHCISLNLPGFGNTEINNPPSVEYYAAFVLETLKRMNVCSYTLIGHSMSGKIAVEMAVQDQAGCIQQLILLAPSPPTIERMPDAEKKRMLNHPNKKVAEETVKKIIVKSISEEQFLTAVNTQLEINETVWCWWINEGMKTPLKGNTKDLNDVPVTVITSEYDPCITLKMVYEDVLPNLPKDTKLILCKGIGHLYPMEDATWLSGTISNALNEK